MARFLIVLGLVILVVGLLWPYLGRIGLGRLPGDIPVQWNAFSLTLHNNKRRRILMRAHPIFGKRPVIRVGDRQKGG